MVPCELAGQQFGRLTALRRFYFPIHEKRDTKPATYWLCRCECGAEKPIRTADLRSGLTQSCGCRKLEMMQVVGVKHGHARPGKVSRIYRIWQGMIKRCHNPKMKEYKNYGGRGITVCAQWRESFDAFFDDVGEPPEDRSLDRINNDGNYEPSNCRWATVVEQRNNRRPYMAIENFSDEVLLREVHRRGLTL